MNAIYKLPEYLAKTGYKNPNSVTDGSFQFAYNTARHLVFLGTWESARLQHFNHHMGAYHQGRPSWMVPDFYPVQELLVKGARTDVDSVPIVNVGGGSGHDLEEFQRKHPNAPGRLVPQDLPAVIEQIREIHERIKPMAHDFYTEQPIKGKQLTSLLCLLFSRFLIILQVLALITCTPYSTTGRMMHVTRSRRRLLRPCKLATASYWFMKM